MSSSAYFLLRLNDHIVYLSKIKATLDDKGDFCGTDYRDCKLGKWLYGEGKDQAAAIGEEMVIAFDELFEPHREFHDASAAAIAAHAEGNDSVENSAFTEMHILSNKLVSILLDLDSLAR